MARGDLLSEEAHEAELDDLAKAFAAFGLVPEGEVDDVQVFHLLPENVEAWCLFIACQRYWHYVGMQPVAIRLERSGVEHEMWRARVRPKNKRRRWNEVCLMESAVLDEWSKRREREQSKA